MIGRPRVEPEERFWAKVSIPPDVITGCWNWTGGLNKYGYGKFGYGGSGHSRGAHRWVFEHLKGPIPRGMFICHHCDNPACVNPAHLFLGTPKDNTRDMMAKGRMRGPAVDPTIRRPRGVEQAHAKLNAASVLEIRALADRGVPRTQLAQQFGVCLTLIRNVVTRKNWSHVQ